MLILVLNIVYEIVLFYSCYIIQIKSDIDGLVDNKIRWDDVDGLVMMMIVDDIIRGSDVDGFVDNNRLHKEISLPQIE